MARNQGGVCFIDLRDHEGIVQVTVEVDNAEVFAVAASLGYEDVLHVEGVVRARHAVNDKMRTGKVEVIATAITVLNKAAPLPFHAHENPGEETRLKYRYLDLRRPEMQRMQRTRIKLVQALRRHLDEKGFQDIETPILTKATPEGARDFLVPARMHPGEFYALPQSPQLFKQILMVAGFDRYYQIARCFRDEALRADRQLEFTQLDMEFAFVRERDVQDFVEDMIRAIFKEVVDVQLDASFPRMTWAEAMRRYGSDKPDLRIALELVDVAELVKDSEFPVFTGPANDAEGRVAALRIRAVRRCRASRSTNTPRMPPSTAPRAWPTSRSPTTAKSARRSRSSSAKRPSPRWSPTSVPATVTSCSSAPVATTRSPTSWAPCA